MAEYSSRGPQALVLQKREVEQPGTDFLDGGSKRRRKSRTSLAITSAARSTTDGDVRRSGGIDRFRSKTVSPFGDRAALLERTDSDEGVGKTNGRKIGARRQKQQQQQRQELVLELYRRHQRHSVGFQHRRCQRRNVDATTNRKIESVAKEKTSIRRSRFTDDVERQRQSSQILQHRSYRRRPEPELDVSETIQRLQVEATSRLERRNRPRR